MFTKVFVKAALERALSTFAQGVLGFIAAGAFTDALSVDWSQAASVGVLAAVLSVLKSVIVGGASDSGSPSVGDAEVLAE